MFLKHKIEIQSKVQIPQISDLQPEYSPPSVTSFTALTQQEYETQIQF